MMCTRSSSSSEKGLENPFKIIHFLVNKYFSAYYAGILLMGHGKVEIDFTLRYWST